MKTRILMMVLTLCLLTFLAGCSFTLPAKKAETQIVKEYAAEEVIPEEKTEPETTTKIAPETIPEDTEQKMAALVHIGFDDIVLEKEYSAEECIVYLLKNLGYDQAAENTSYQHPYKDVKAENNALIGYAYANWLLTKVDGNELNNAVQGTKEVCVNFILHLMGYNDSTIGTPLNFARKLGIECLSDSETFTGNTLVNVMWTALRSSTNDEETWSSSLIDNGRLYKKLYEDAEYLAKGEEIPVPQVKESEKPVTIVKTPEKTQETKPTEQPTENYWGGYDDDDGASWSAPTDNGTSSPEPSETEDVGGGAGGDNETPPVAFG